METLTVKASAGEEIEVLPEGARVRHRRHPHLTGRIRQHEMHESGTFSPIPYNISWDDFQAARTALGLLCIYGDPYSVEPE